MGLKQNWKLKGRKDKKRVKEKLKMSKEKYSSCRGKIQQKGKRLYNRVDPKNLL